MIESLQNVHCGKYSFPVPKQSTSRLSSGRVMSDFELSALYHRNADSAGGRNKHSTFSLQKRCTESLHFQQMMVRDVLMLALAENHRE